MPLDNNDDTRRAIHDYTSCLLFMPNEPKTFVRSNKDHISGIVQRQRPIPTFETLKQKLIFSLAQV